MWPSSPGFRLVVAVLTTIAGVLLARVGLYFTAFGIMYLGFQPFGLMMPVPAWRCWRAAYSYAGSCSGPDVVLVHVQLRRRAEPLRCLAAGGSAIIRLGSER